jgi:hypothetical protein
MKTLITLVSFSAPLVLLACTPEQEAANLDSAESPVASNVVEITAIGLQFQGPTEVAPGWTTFRFRNQSGLTHFAVLERVPEGIGVAEQQAEVAPVFQEGMNLLATGNVDAAMAAFGRLPEWFSSIVFYGGPGLLAPNQEAEATVNLEPGTYLIECYVKTDGVFHSYNPTPGQAAMVHQLTVSGEPSQAAPPAPSVRIVVSSGRGFEVAGQPVAGSNTVEVRFEDQMVYPNFVGHDLHLARVDAAALDELNAWMDWTQPGGLETNAPATFLGGVNEMPAGSTTYFTVDLEPGSYAWVAEVPDPAGKGMLQAFTVPAAP